MYLHTCVICFLSLSLSLLCIHTFMCAHTYTFEQIMLGLVSHEPHFSLLREEVRFGKKAQKRQTTPDTVTFHLLHLSIMREYLDFEFATLKVSCCESGRERR